MTGTVKDYIDALPDERKPAVRKIRAVLRKHLPKGFSEVMSYGMIGYVVPHRLFPDGYHVDPAQPLPFINLASQKSHIALYHMGLYSDPALLKWFQAKYKKLDIGKLDMGKSCIRFKRPEIIPVALIGELATRMTPKQWISIYQKSIALK